jgi:hypothetical protein
MRSRCCPCVCVFVCVCVSPLFLLGNGSVKVSLSLLGNGYVFYVARVVSKKSRRLVLPRSSCSYMPKCGGREMSFDFVKIILCTFRIK